MKKKHNFTHYFDLLDRSLMTSAKVLTDLAGEPLISFGSASAVAQVRTKLASGRAGFSTWPEKKGEKKEKRGRSE
jgi:hypothetical protein